jgi:hypothetical protein
LILLYYRRYFCVLCVYFLSGKTWKSYCTKQDKQHWALVLIKLALVHGTPAIVLLQKKSLRNLNWAISIRHSISITWHWIGVIFIAEKGFCLQILSYVFCSYTVKNQIALGPSH